MIDKLIGVTVLLANFDQLDDQLASENSAISVAWISNIWASWNPRRLLYICPELSELIDWWN